jgi:hypothetical protein
MKRFIELLPEEMFTLRRDAPLPVTFRFDASPDPHELAMCRGIGEREQLYKRLKRQASFELAEKIAKECKWFDAGCGIEGPRIRLEVTLHDSGSYEDWRRTGAREGRKAAIKEMMESLPYGMADAAKEFYE